MPRRSTATALFSAVLTVTLLTASAAVTKAEPAGRRSDAAAGASATTAADSSKTVAAPQQPVRISADAAEYSNKEGLVVFIGNVVAVQADSTITADRMEVTFSKAASAEGQPAPGIGTPAAARNITRIVAQSKVSFRQVDAETGKERYATGDRGVYDVERRVVTMSGSPRVWEGKNVIVGEEMTFHLDEKKMIVKGDGAHKVTFTIFPDELKEEKKP